MTFTQTDLEIAYCRHLGAARVAAHLTEQANRLARLQQRDSAAAVSRAAAAVAAREWDRAEEILRYGA